MQPPAHLPKRSPAAALATAEVQAHEEDEDVVMVEEVEASQARKRRKLSVAGNTSSGAAGKLRQTQIACKRHLVAVKTVG